MSWWDKFIDWFKRLWAQPAPPAGPQGSLPEPVERKVLLVIYNPRVPGQGNNPLIEVLGWNSPALLVEGYLADLHQSSHGYLTYTIVETLEVDHFPVKQDGFTYTPDDYLHCWQTNSGFHQPDAVDYAAILTEFHIARRVNDAEIDEVWLFGMPYGGFYESIMGGPDAFFCNAPVLVTSGIDRRFIIMGFNYQRGVGEMLEAFGHRAESILRRVFRATSGDANLWERFNRIDRTAPGQAEVGSVHYAPNSKTDYDWGNTQKVLSRSRSWANFPDLSAPAVEMDSAEWGGGNIRAHHVWWLSLFPHIQGESNGIAWNWWKYACDPNLVE